MSDVDRTPHPIEAQYRTDLGYSCALLAKWLEVGKALSNRSSTREQSRALLRTLVDDTRDFLARMTDIETADEAA